MLTLRRAVRFAINPPHQPHGPAFDPVFPGRNGYAGVPAIQGLGRYFELNVEIRGHPDPLTGYLINIKDIDHAVRDSVIPRIADACNHAPQSEPAALLPALITALNRRLDTATPCSRLRWNLTPYHSIEMAADNTTTFLLRQRFDFAASHRLHIPALSDDENRALFGKCNNPGGHGHNYQFEPCIAATLENGRPSFTLADLEQLAHETIITRFDHKHLNLDTPEFDPGRGGLNPTVENIAKVFYTLLTNALHPSRARLHSITVWETDRTSATYPASNQ